MTEKFTDSQLSELRDQFSILKMVNPDRLEEFRSIFSQCSNMALDQLCNAGIKFISNLAKNERTNRYLASNEKSEDTKIAEILIETSLIVYCHNCGELWSQHTATVCPRCFNWPKEKEKSK